MFLTLSIDEDDRKERHDLKRQFLGRDSNHVSREHKETVS